MGGTTWACAAGNAAIVTGGPAGRRDVCLASAVVAVERLPVIVACGAHSYDSCDLAGGFNIGAEEVAVAHIKAVVAKRGDWENTVAPRKLHRPLKQDVVGVVART